MTILDQIAEKRRFTAGSVEDVVGFQVAKRFHDEENLAWYVRCVAKHGTDRVFRAFIRCGLDSDDARTRFRSILDN